MVEAVVALAGEEDEPDTDDLAEGELPFQGWYVGKWRSRNSATCKRCKEANRTGMSSTRSTLSTQGVAVFMDSVVSLSRLSEKCLFR